MKKMFSKLVFLLGFILLGYSCLAQETTDTTGSTEREEPGSGTYNSGTHNTTYPDGTVYMPHDNSGHAENMSPKVYVGLTKKIIDCGTDEKGCRDALENASAYALQNTGSGSSPQPKLSNLAPLKGSVTTAKRNKFLNDVKAETTSLQSQKKGVYVLKDGKWTIVQDINKHTQDILKRLKAVKPSKKKG